jgi:hypothetical protein
MKGIESAFGKIKAREQGKNIAQGLRLAGMFWQHSMLTN